jgi:hypothetical protein
MRSEPSGSETFRLTEGKRASAIAVRCEIALIQDVHPNQGIELECIGKLDANDLVEHERIRRVSSRLVWSKSNPKRIALDLPFSLGRLERPLAQAN